VRHVLSSIHLFVKNPIEIENTYSLAYSDGKDSVLVDSFVSKDRLTSWDFQARNAKTPSELPSSEERPSTNAEKSVPVYNGPPHVLEIGCSDGAWVFKFKSDMPDWIVEGVDDTDHWSCVQHDLELRYV
jgi:hypothetical protein